jgi:hypothetical protein
MTGALRDDLDLEQLEVFFLNATSVSFERIAKHPNHQ